MVIYIRILCIGDTHQDTKELENLLSKNYDLALIIGDFIEEDVLEHIPTQRPIYFILGNHDYELFSYAPKVSDLGNTTFVRTGKRYTHEGLTIGGINGNYSPKNFNDKRESSPHRRHFTLEDIKKCRALKGLDIFMTHEPPKEFGDLSFDGLNFGCGRIKRLIDIIKPKITLHGHIHRLQIDQEDDRYSINVGYGKTGDHVIIDSDRIELVQSKKLKNG